MLELKAMKKRRDTHFGCSFAEVLLQSTFATKECAYELPATARETVSCGQAVKGGLCGNPISLNKEERGLCPQLIKAI